MLEGNMTGTHTHTYAEVGHIMEIGTGTESMRLMSHLKAMAQVVSVSKYVWCTNMETSRNLATWW